MRRDPGGPVMRSLVQPCLRFLLAGALAGTSALVGAVPGQAAYPHPVITTEEAEPGTSQLVPTNAVPRPRVDALAALDGSVYLGGLFRRVQDSSDTYRHRNIAAVDETTGQVLPFSPDLNGRVYALAAQGGSVYVGGTFKTVNGVRRAYLAKVDAQTGRVDRRFNARLKGLVHHLEIARGMLFVSGSFGRRLVALDPATGADTGYFNLEITGEIRNAWGRTSVYEFAINPSATRLVGVGNFTTVSGQDRARAFMARLRPGRARLSSWYYDSLAKRCYAENRRRVAYLQGVDFAPDGSYFVLVATGNVPRRKSQIGETVCDAAARFETDIADPHRPTWINYTGGDSLWSVAATGAAVYVQGHIRWLDNPYGRDSAGPGAVRRPGIGAIDPVTGKALAWDPAKPATIGGKAFLATSSGLWVGSDSRKFASEPRRGLAYVPLSDQSS